MGTACGMLMKARVRPGVGVHAIGYGVIVFHDIVVHGISAAGILEWTA